MNILLTGSAGFVGRSLIPFLKRQNHTVIGIDLREDYYSDLAFQHDLREEIPFELPPFDLCVHLASNVGGILHNHLHAGLEDYELQLLKNVHRLCQQHSCRRMIYTSSVSVFEQSGVFDHGPLEIFNQITPYARAKTEGERFVQAEFEEFVILRPTNIFGKEQNTLTDLQVGQYHVIPELLKKLGQSLQLEILGDGSQIRNFIHVSDVCRFIQRVLSAPAKGWYNLRSEIQISIQELAQQLMEQRGVTKEIVYQPEFLKYEPHPIHLFKMDEVLELGWKAEVDSLQAGLQF